MNLDEARAITVELGLTPSYENLRRVVQGHDLIQRGFVHHRLTAGNMRLYRVKSQTSGETYTVGVNGSLPLCNCPDDVRVCKHGIAVMLSEAATAEAAWCTLMDAYQADRFACDGHELY